MKTRVCITVDIEFSIGGAFIPPHVRRPIGLPMVWCPVDGVSHGLGFVLRCFEAHGIHATFFIEALHPNYFPPHAMQPAVDAIAAAGHEIQLHLHPAWQVFAHADWRERVVRDPQQDDLAGRPREELVALIEAGCANFVRWGLQRPRALRTGNLHHASEVYEAMAQAGLDVASNIGLGIYRGVDPRHVLYSGCHDLDGVLEMPLLTYADWTCGSRHHLKTLTIQGCGRHETERLLWAAHEAQVPSVVLLTHPFEYVHVHDHRFDAARPNTLTQGRLHHLCEFLARHADCFASSGLVEAADDISPAARGRNVLLDVPAWTGMRRLMENRMVKWSTPATAARRGARGRVVEEG